MQNTEWLWLHFQIPLASLQAESNGEEWYSDSIHMQDTCMTVCSESTIAQQLVDICETIDEQF